MCIRVNGRRHNGMEPLAATMFQGRFRMVFIQGWANVAVYTAGCMSRPVCVARITEKISTSQCNIEHYGA